MSKDEKIFAVKNVKSPLKNLDDFTQRSRQTVLSNCKNNKHVCPLLPQEKNQLPIHHEQ